MPKFKMQAKLELTCQRIIEADSEEDAYQHADTMTADEWMTMGAAREQIEDVICVARESSKPRKTAQKAGAKHD